MNWLNLRTETLRSPEFANAKPGAIETWLKVLAHCCEQENGGRIAGGALWGDRAWLMCCGVTKAEVETAAPLIFTDGEDTVVSAYPSEREAEVQAKREAGKAGGKASGKARRKPKPQAPVEPPREAVLQAENEAVVEAVLEAPREALLERKDKGKGNGNRKDKGNGMEREGEVRVVEDDDCGPRPGESPTLSDWLSSCARLSIPEWYATNKFHVWEAKGWAMGRTPVVWKKCVPLASQDFQNDGRPMTPEAAKPKNGKPDLKNDTEAHTRPGKFGF